MTTNAPQNPQTGAAAAPALPERDIAIEGRLDATAILRLRRAATEAVANSPVMILVDVSGVTHVTASGLAGVLELLRLARSRGGDVRLYGASKAMADAQLFARLTEISRVYEDRQQALDGTQRAASDRRGPRQRRSADNAARGRLEERLTSDARQGTSFPIIDGISIHAPD